VISIVMVAAVAELDAERRIARARVAVGACSEVAQRLPQLEAALVGLPAGSEAAGLARTEHLAGLTPIDDVRGSGAYRREVALTLVRRALATVLA
jgi:CO/xanthine dehydrogenase FAD-binding subunit